MKEYKITLNLKNNGFIKYEIKGEIKKLEKIYKRLIKNGELIILNSQQCKTIINSKEIVTVQIEELGWNNEY